MPAGASWGVYTRFFIGCFIATYAGSQTVHKIYKPLDGFQEAVNEEKRRILKEEAEALERKAQQKLENTV